MRIKLSLIFLFCFLSVKFSYSQNIEEFGLENIEFITSISEAEELAKTDIKNGTLHLLLVSGINPSFDEYDSQIQKKYNFKYTDFGCVAPDNEFIVAYNRVILKSLCEKYGKKILKKLRKDLIGYKTFKKEKLCRQK